MKNVLLFAALVFTAHVVLAQSAAMPQPVAVVKDADGKVIAQVAGFITDGERFSAMVVIDVEGATAFLVFQPYGLVDRVHWDSQPGSVYFTDTLCTGNAYVNQIADDVLERHTGTVFGVAGPDPTLGTYKLYRSTSLSAPGVAISSEWRDGVCVGHGTTMQLMAAEEVIPNPLAGFHGPTTLNPERILTIDGGDRLP